MRCASNPAPPEAKPAHGH